MLHIEAVPILPDVPVQGLQHGSQITAIDQPKLQPILSFDPVPFQRHWRVKLNRTETRICNPVPPIEVDQVEHMRTRSEFVPEMHSSEQWPPFKTESIQRHAKKHIQLKAIAAALAINELLTNSRGASEIP